MQNLTAVALAQWLNDPKQAKPVLLDVREPWEIQLAQIPGNQSIPLRELPQRFSELSTDMHTPIVCICHYGGRSAQAALFLEAQGYRQVHNLEGGVDAWARQVDSKMPTY